MIKIKRTIAKEILEPVHEGYKRHQKNVVQEQPKQIIEKGPGNKYQPSKDFHMIFSNLIGESKGTVKVVDAINVLDVRPERAVEEARTAERTVRMLDGRSNLPQLCIVESKPVVDVATTPVPPSVFERFSRIAEAKDDVGEAAANPEKPKPAEHEETHKKTPVSVFERLSQK
jgi:hypothetical protein